MSEYWVGHRERLRGRAQESGIGALRPHEIIELVLFQAVPRVDVTEVARALVNGFGSVQAVLSASEGELMAVPGVTKAMARWIMLTGEMIDAYAGIDRGSLPRIWRYRDVMRFLAPRWRDVPAPQCWMIYTDYDDRLMTYSVICDSLHWSDPRCTREVVEEALALQARHAFLVMFTGTQPLEPEPGEIDCLVSFARTLRAADVELMDCVAVGEAGYMSMNLEGRMEAVRVESELPSLHERYVSEEDDHDEQDRAIPEGEQGAV